MIKLGLIGEKLGHSLSPEIHSLILENLNLEGEYGLYEVSPMELWGKLLYFRQSGFRGLNVTIPYKVSIMKYLDEISPEALKIGAVNTIALRDGIFRGYNTDYLGVMASFERFEVEIKGSSAVILGTGGAAASVFQCLEDLGAESIKLVSRNPEGTSDRWKQRGGVVISYEELDKLQGDLIINCTPKGMFPNIEASPVNENTLMNFETAFDLIYNPRETKFLQGAMKAGLKTIGGLYMLVAQAVYAEGLWNDIKIDKKAIENIYLKFVKN